MLPKRYRRLRINLIRPQSKGGVRSGKSIARKGAIGDIGAKVKFVSTSSGTGAGMTNGRVGFRVVESIRCGSVEGGRAGGSEGRGGAIRAIVVQGGSTGAGSDVAAGCSDKTRLRAENKSVRTSEQAVQAQLIAPLQALLEAATALFLISLSAVTRSRVRLLIAFRVSVGTIGHRRVSDGGPEGRCAGSKKDPPSCGRSQSVESVAGKFSAEITASGAKCFHYSSRLHRKEIDGSPFLVGRNHLRFVAQKRAIGCILLSFILNNEEKV